MTSEILILSPVSDASTVRVGDTVLLDGAPRVVSRVRATTYGLSSVWIGRTKYDVSDKDGIVRRYPSIMHDRFTEHTLDTLETPAA